jgi:hypothetical protein
MTNTQDLSKFGYRELAIAGELLTKYANGNMTKLAKDYAGDGIKLEFNLNSGHVFLVDEDYNALMLNDDKLDLWIWLSHTGEEGFYNELIERFDELHYEDQEQLKQYQEVQE